MITPLKKVPSLTQPRASYGTAYTLAAAANKFGDVFLQKVALNSIQYLSWFAREAFPGEGLELPVESSDVCDTIRLELRQVREFVLETELTVLEWSWEHHSRLADELEEQMEEDAHDPPYVPPKKGESSSSEEEEESPNPPKRPRPSGLRTSNRRPHDGQVVPILPVGAPPAPSDYEDSNSGPRPSDPRTTDGQVAPILPLGAPPAPRAEDDFSSGDDSSTPVPKLVAKKRQHHAIRTCPVCDKPDANLKRHLLSHARKRHIEAEDVEKHLSCAIHNERRHGPRRAKGKKGLLKK